MSVYSEFLAVSYLREQINKGGENHVTLATTKAQRIAIEERYQVLLKYVLEQIESNNEHLKGLSR